MANVEEAELAHEKEVLHDVEAKYSAEERKAHALRDSTINVYFPLISH